MQNCNVSEINAFWHFTHKFKMVAKNGGITLSRTVSKINAFLRFTREYYFWEKLPDDCGNPGG